eukprot:4718999-Heterocapsa_arctica.AAC.1
MPTTSLVMLVQLGEVGTIFTVYAGNIRLASPQVDCNAKSQTVTTMLRTCYGLYTPSSSLPSMTLLGG